MKRVILLVVTGITFLVAAVAASVQSRLLVDSYVQGEMAKHQIPGAAVAVLRNGRTELIAGYGLANIERKIAVTPETLFQIASTTKPFTAIAIMMLVEDRKVSLDDTASVYLPWLPALYGKVTVRHLLTHTSGINRDVRTANVDNFTLDEFKRRFAAAPASFTPGERWEYSNNGYILLGMIIEAVSRKPYGDFLTQRVFRPLDMNNTRYNDPPGADANRAVGYDWTDNAYKPSPYFHGGYSAGGLVSSVADLAKWARALDEKKLLKQSSLEQMWTPVTLRDGRTLSFEFRGKQSGYGFGWFLTTYNDRKLITHGGTLSGFSSQVHRLADDRITIVVLTNSRSGADRIGYSEVLANGIANLYFSNKSEK